jgi:hypothetical protein
MRKEVKGNDSYYQFKTTDDYLWLLEIIDLLKQQKFQELYHLQKVTSDLVNPSY